jgi:O-antigen ligase
MNSAKFTRFLIVGLLCCPFVFHGASLVFTLLLLLVWFVEGDLKRKFNFLKVHPFLFLLPGFYLLFMLGLLYSSNLSFGIQKAETRLSLLILPIVLPTLKHADWRLNGLWFFSWFIRIATFSSFVCITQGLYHYFEELNAIKAGANILKPVGYNYFFSSHLTDFIMHPGYYAVYVVMAIFALLNLMLYKPKNFLKWYNGLALIVLLTLLFLSYAKAALIVFVMLSIIFGIQIAYHKSKWVYLFYGGFTALFTLLVFYFFVPNTQERIQAIRDVVNTEKLDPTSTESTQARAHTWRGAFAALKKSPWFGFGTGDANDELFMSYRELNYTGVLSREYNAHNEYLQTALALGIVGGVFLMLPFVFSLRYAIKQRNFYLGSWALLTMVVLLFESYLNMQSGSLFVALFFSILPFVRFDEAEALNL